LVLPGAPWMWYTILIGIAVAFAVVGYDLLHFIQRWLTYLLIVVFAILTVGALTTLDAGSAIPDTSGFGWAPFLITFGAAAGYQISYAVYVSDYSRYLRKDVPARGVISWTYLGAAASAVWLMALGAFLGSSIVAPDAIGSLQLVGNSVFPGFGTFAVLVCVPALVSIMAINFYGAMLTGASAVDGFRPVKATVRSRVIGIAVVAVIAYVVALLIPDNYLGSFNNFVLLMLYFLIPWTAVNLVDFYFVRRGHYAITEIFKPAGIYGRWSWRGLVAYVVGFAAMIPFLSTSFYVGPAAEALDGADISFIVGLLVSGGLYLILCRGLDLGAEQAAIVASDEELEAQETAS
jgi:purine-cytosine permease-like protein